VYDKKKTMDDVSNKPRNLKEEDRNFQINKDSNYDSFSLQ